LREDFRYGVNVKSVARQNDGAQGKPPWQIRVSSGDEINADAIVLATPAYAAAPALCLQRWPILRHGVFVDPDSAALVSVEVRPAGKCCCSRVQQFVAELVCSQEPYTTAVTRWPEN